MDPCASDNQNVHLKKLDALVVAIDSCPFDKLFSKNVPHILEKIFFPVISEDYKSIMLCLKVCKKWHSLLTSTSYQVNLESFFRV